MNYEWMCRLAYAPTSGRSMDTWVKVLYDVVVIPWPYHWYNIPSMGNVVRCNFPAYAWILYVVMLWYEARVGGSTQPTTAVRVIRAARFAYSFSTWWCWRWWWLWCWGLMLLLPLAGCCIDLEKFKCADARFIFSLF